MLKQISGKNCKFFAISKLIEIEICIIDLVDKLVVAFVFGIFGSLNLAFNY